MIWPPSKKWQEKSSRSQELWRLTRFQGVPSSCFKSASRADANDSNNNTIPEPWLLNRCQRTLLIVRLTPARRNLHSDDTVVPLRSAIYRLYSGYSGNLNRSAVSWGLVNPRGLFFFPLFPCHFLFLLLQSLILLPLTLWGKKEARPHQHRDGQRYANALLRLQKAARANLHKTWSAEEALVSFSGHVCEKWLNGKGIPPIFSATSLLSTPLAPLQLLAAVLTFPLDPWPQLWWENAMNWLVLFHSPSLRHNSLSPTAQSSINANQGKSIQTTAVFL